jgi:hypothetical protein
MDIVVVRIVEDDVVVKPLFWLVLLGPIVWTGPARCPANRLIDNSIVVGEGREWLLCSIDLIFVKRWLERSEATGSFRLFERS